MIRLKYVSERNNVKPLTLNTLSEASEQAMEVGKKIKARADKMRAKNASVRSGESTTDKGHAEHVAKSDAQSPPGERKTSPVKGRLTKDQLDALKNRAKRKLKEPSERSKRDYESVKDWDNYFKGEYGNR